jgi:predicted transcriptional regulator
VSSGIPVNFLEALDPYPRTTRELAAVIHVARPHAQACLAELEQRSLVVRSGEDWQLTPSGRTAVLEARRRQAG